MQVAARSTRFSVGRKRTTTHASRLLACTLACILAQHSASARPDADQVYFHAVALPSAAATAELVSAPGAESSSFAAFVPMADSAAIRDLIAGLEEAGDYYSPVIAEHAAELGKALQAEGQYQAALEAYDRSLNIVRRAEGLFSYSQIRLLQARIDTHLAMGDMETSDSLQQSLFMMQQQVLAADPIALAQANLAAADWNLKYYLQAAQNPLPGGRTPEQEHALDERLGRAFMQYHKALWLYSNADVNGLVEEKVELERRIAAVTLMVNRKYREERPTTLTKLGQRSYAQTQRANNPVLFRHGSSALQRAIDYSVATAEPQLVAERQLELADWYLLLDQHDEAQAAYAAARSSLREAGMADADIASALGAGLPVQDPAKSLTFMASADGLTEFEGFIDVSFNVNRYGEASNAHVLSGSAHDPQLEQYLLQEIEAGRFRPGFDAGTPVAQSDVRLRYFFARQP
jgi:tetratricopeptide (TPR) repeat protein